MQLLNDLDAAAIAEAIKQAETKTSGEIVFVTTVASSHYQPAILQGALVGMALTTAIYLLLPVVHNITEVLWTEFISFALFSSLLPHIPWRRWLIPAREMDARVQQAALAEFYARGIYRTRDSNGILIFLSYFERRVIVLGDRAIHEKVGDRWDQVRDLILNGISSGKARDGICSAIESCGTALAQHFPHRSDDVNELPDEVIRRPLKTDTP